MKTRILSLIVIALLAGIILTSCGETSKEDVKSAQENLKEAGGDLNQARKDAEAEIKKTVQSDWQKFKMASETSIENTKNQIQEIRAKIAKASKSEKEKLTKELDKLEQKNKQLEEKLMQRGKEFKEDMINFNESAKSDEQKFEREFTHDMNELGTALKDLFKNNVN